MKVEVVTCPASEYQGKFYPTTSAGDEVILSCDEGYSGSIVRSCSATGQWEAPVNSCSG